MKYKGKKIELSTTQIIISGFLIVILIGALLLMLPVSSAAGTSTSFVDSLFTAATSVCVTGLVVVDTYSHWSYFGQAVILVLIQCGGLGIVTITTGIMVITGRKVTLSDRLLLQDAYNLNTLSGLVKFMKRILKGTFLVEGIGAVLLMCQFIPEFGLRGIWISVFTSISAFCNAGMDIIGNTSLAQYVGNPLVNVVVAVLIILGGIGFIVWWDILKICDQVRKKEIKIKSFFQRLSLHSKIVIVTTAILLFGGALIIFALEYNNVDTMGNLSFAHKLMASMFQSVTTRTAGFLTISQKGLRDATAFVCIIMMFVGGSPVGTAGGIKTSTIALLFLSARSTVKGTEDVSVFRKTIPKKTIKKAIAVIVISISVAFGLIILLSIVNGGDFVDVAFETISAIATVGLSRDYTSTLNTFGKLLITFGMYLGRVGPISLVIAIGFKKGKKGVIIYPEEDVTVG